MKRKEVHIYYLTSSMKNCPSLEDEFNNLFCPANNQYLHENSQLSPQGCQCLDLPLHAHTCGSLHQEARKVAKLAGGSCAASPATHASAPEIHSGSFSRPFMSCIQSPVCTDTRNSVAFSSLALGFRSFGSPPIVFATLRVTVFFAFHHIFCATHFCRNATPKKFCYLMLSHPIPL